MAEQAVDVRSWVATLRRHSGLLLAATVLGAAGGATLAIMVPPQFSSESVVLLPPLKGDDGQTTTRNSATEVKIAGSDVVMGPAGRSVSPSIPARRLQKAVDISASTDDVVEFVAHADTAARAEELAQAVAEAEKAYLMKASSSLGGAEAAALRQRREDLEDSLDTVTAEVEKTRARIQQELPTSVEGKADASALAQLTAEQADLVLKLDQVKAEALGADLGKPASIIQPATPARRPGMVVRAALFAWFGALATLALVAILVGLAGSRDRRMRQRDEIADAIGGHVVGSLRVFPQRSAAQWVTMLADYTPSSVDVLALRNMLRETAPQDGSPEQRVETGERGIIHPTSLTVITIAGDDRAHAVGPQIAAFAASAGVRTRLVVGRSHDSAAPLFAACNPERAGEEVRPGLLLEARGRKQKVDFTVVIVVVDRDQPDLSHVPRSAVTVLAVSSGAATAEDLARVAVAADETGRLVSGVVVADPDATDRTTGRLMQHERAQQAALPSRLTGIGPDGRGDGVVKGIRGGA
jgi:hypothetical protein